MEQVGADLKIRLVFSIPGKPRGRGRIERFFSTVNEMFSVRVGWLRTGQRRCARKANTSRWRTSMPGSAGFCLDVYHRRECAETKTPPAERWEATGFLPRMPDSLEQLDLLLIQVAQDAPGAGRWHSLLRTSATSRQLWRRTSEKRLHCAWTHATWPKSVSFTRTGSCVQAVCPELAGARVPLSRDSSRPKSASARAARCSTGPAERRRYAPRNEARRNHGERRCSTSRRGHSQAIGSRAQTVPERIATVHRP